MYRFLSQYPEGFRVFWDGKGSLFLENKTKIFKIPDDVLEQFPKDIPLEGILRYSLENLCNRLVTNRALMN